MSEQDETRAVALAAQLRSNADAHQESVGTERRRAADMIEAQQQRIRELEQQLAARDAVIARLKALPQTDWGMGNAGLDAHSVYAILAAAPESVLAEVKAQALEEEAERFATGEWVDAFVQGNVDDDISAVQATEEWFRARAAEYRNGADHE